MMNIKDNRTGGEEIFFKDLRIGDVYYVKDCDNFICIKIDENRCLLKSLSGLDWDTDYESDNQIVHPLNATLVVDD